MAGSLGWTNDPHFTPSEEEAQKNREAENVLLEEPYAKAVLGVGDYKHQDVLQAIRTLQKRNTPLTAEALLQEVMERESQAKDRTLVPARRGHLKRPADDCLGSDGESEDGYREYLDVPSPLAAKDDLQEDGAAAARLIVDSVENSAPREPPKKRSSLERTAGGGKELSHLRRKLMALREENRWLKARKLCRKCGVKAVAITFLPCGHFCYCYQCGQGFQTCPVCQKKILADVRTFLA